MTPILSGHTKNVPSHPVLYLLQSIPGPYLSLVSHLFLLLVGPVTSKSFVKLNRYLNLIQHKRFMVICSADEFKSQVVSSERQGKET